MNVRRSELLSIRQDQGENARSFFANINGKAVTCSCSLECSSATCTNQVDFTDVRDVKDSLINGLSGGDIKKDVLGWADLDNKTVHETVAFVEAREIAP